MENEDTNLETIDREQADDPSLSENPTLELPENPEELKALALKTHKQLIESRRNEKHLSNEAQRLKDTVEEERTGKVLWHQKWEQEVQTKGNNKPAEKPAAPQRRFKDDMELAELATSGVTIGDLREEFRKEFVTEEAAEQVATRIADRKAESLTRESGQARQVVETYPDLANENSPLMRATVDEMQRLQREAPSMDKTAAFELAAHRAANRLNYKAPAKSSNGNGSDKERERERLRNAQPGPGSRATAPKGTVTITDQDRLMARRMNGGVDMPDAQIKAAKQRLVEGQQQQRA